MKEYTTQEGIVKHKMTATLASVEIIHSTYQGSQQIQQYASVPQQTQGDDSPPF